MRINTKKVLTRIDTDLYYGTGQMSHDKNIRAQKLVEYVHLAYENKLEEVPEYDLEFAKSMKGHWPEMEKLKNDTDRKNFLRKKIQDFLKSCQKIPPN